MASMLDKQISLAFQQIHLGGYFLLKGLNTVRKKQIAILLIVIILPYSAQGNLTCKGRFVNPISDICWSCLLPISIGSVSFSGGNTPAKRDIKNPDSPLCMCNKGSPPIPVPGITLGFWEPVR